MESQDSGFPTLHNLTINLGTPENARFRTEARNKEAGHQAVATSYLASSCNGTPLPAMRSARGCVARRDSSSVGNQQRGVAAGIASAVPSLPLQSCGHVGEDGSCITEEWKKWGRQFSGCSHGRQGKGCLPTAFSDSVMSLRDVLTSRSKPGWRSLLSLALRAPQVVLHPKCRQCLPYLLRMTALVQSLQYCCIHRR